MILFPFQGLKERTIEQPLFGPDSVQSESNAVQTDDSSSDASESGSQVSVLRQASDALVNAVILPKIPLWESCYELSKDVMWVLVAFSCPDHAIEKVTLPEDISAVPKRKVKGRILTFTQSLQATIEERMATIEGQEATIRHLREQLEQNKVFPLCLCSGWMVLE